jgi:hypothetical protein
MTGDGVPDRDMTRFPWPTQPEVGALDALLSGYGKPEEGPAELRPVAEVLLALQAPPDQREVAKWEEALTAYRATMASLPRMSSWSRSRRPKPNFSALGAKLAAAVGAAVITAFGGGIAAAYTGSLPAALQRFAHVTIAAPAVHSSPAGATPRGTSYPAGPTVAGGAAFGLCNAYQNAEEHGTASQRSVAFRNLVKAADGAGRVAAYCAAVPHPGPAAPPGRRTGQTGSPAAAASHGRKPTAPPGKPSKPPGKPSKPPGKPTAPPGKPSTPPGNGNGNGNGGG